MLSSNEELVQVKCRVMMRESVGFEERFWGKGHGDRMP